MKLDDILHVEATALGTEVVSLKDREISPDVLKTDSGQGRADVSLPAGGLANGDVAGGAGRAARPGHARMKSNFAAKRDVQIVVADPAEILKGH